MGRGGGRAGLTRETGRGFPGPSRKGLWEQKGGCGRSPIREMSQGMEAGKACLGLEWSWRGRGRHWLKAGWTK